MSTSSRRGKALARWVTWGLCFGALSACSSADGGVSRDAAVGAAGADAAGGNADGEPESGEPNDAAQDQPAGPDPFADEVVSFTPGPNAGFGAEKLPDIVLGPPRGSGANAGSLHVVSLGDGGEIVLGFDDIVVVDGPGPDLLVFENAFEGWAETGQIAVSEDGVDWLSFPCEATNTADGYPGCAGVHPVHAHADDPSIDATDPTSAGGDAFDLADIGATLARYVRIRDTGTNDYAGNSGGFDLDAVAVVNGAPADP